MVRISAFLIALCMVLIAASLGMIVYARFGFTGAESALAATAALTALAVYYAVAARKHDRLESSNQLAKLARGAGDLAVQLAEFSRRLSAIEAKVESTVERAAAISQPLADEVSRLSASVKELTASVAAQETALRDRTSAGQSEVEDLPAIIAAEASVNAATVARLQFAASASRNIPSNGKTAPVADFERESPIVALRNAVAAGDIVSNPEAARLLAQLDHVVAGRCVQIVRRLLLRKREVGLFCNLAAVTLADPSFPKFIELMEANRAIAAALVFEFTQSAVRAMRPIEHASLAALADRGFRFSMDNLGDLSINARELNERGFRFVKVPASLLFNRLSVVAGDIRPAEFSDSLGRFGIDLIADRIEHEHTVIDLLDYDVRFGQGVLFSPPRPLRAGILEAAEGKVAEENGADDAAATATAISPRSHAPA